MLLPLHYSELLANGHRFFLQQFSLLGGLSSSPPFTQFSHFLSIKMIFSFANYNYLYNILHAFRLPSSFSMTLGFSFFGERIVHLLRFYATFIPVNAVCLSFRKPFPNPRCIPICTAPPPVPHRNTSCATLSCDIFYGLSPFIFPFKITL